MLVIMEIDNVIKRSSGCIPYGCLPYTSEYKQEGIS
jgi:hypothetical protein